MMNAKPQRPCRPNYKPLRHAAACCGLLLLWAGAAWGAPAPGMTATPAPAAATLATPTTQTQATTGTQPTTATQTQATTATQQRSTPKGDPGFYLEVEPREAHLGDSVTIRLRSRDANFHPDKIDDVNFEPDEKVWYVESQWRRDWQAQADGRPGSWHATLRPFQTGPGKSLTLNIPATKVVYQRPDGQKAEAQATTASLTVFSIRPENSKQLTLIGLRDPAAIPREWGWAWKLAAAVLGAAALAWLLWRWWVRRKRLPLTAPLEPELPPGLWALRELDLRSRLAVCQTGPAKAIFSLVSEVIRLYLGRRYGIPAIDMTTLECLHSLHVLKLDGEVLRWIREFLDECDLVKFTTFEPTSERWNTIWHDARLIIKMTTPAEELDPGAKQDQGVAREVPA